MYSSVVRGEKYKSRLTDFIRREYGIVATSITATKRGFYGETWKVNDENSQYFLKLVMVY